MLLPELSVSFFPPDARVYHPSKEYPVLPYAVGKEKVLPIVTIFELSPTLPPLASNVAVYLLAVHLAVKVFDAVT